MANVIQTFPKGTGGGHTILDNSGAAVTDRKELQFKGLNVTDNSTDEVTEVEGVGLNQDSLNDIANANISNVMVGSGDNYSTSEQIVGRWYDGKPLYQKTIEYNNPNTSWSPISFSSLGINNIDKSFKYGSAYCILNGTICMSEHSWTDGSAKSYFTIMIYGDSVYISCSASGTKSKIVFTVRYTKTTDT